MAAIVIRGIAAHVLSVVKNWPPISCGSPCWNSVMSAPAAKMRSPPVSTTAPGGSEVNDSAAESSCRRTSDEIAFTFGLSSRTTATPLSRRSTCTTIVSSAMAADVSGVPALLDPAEDLVGRRVRIGRAVEHPPAQLLEPLAPAGLAGPVEQPLDHDGPQLLDHPLLPATAELARLLQILAVGLDRRPYLVDALASRCDRGHDRRPPAVGVTVTGHQQSGHVEHVLEIPPG